ncbi:MAG TPA: type IX secretion system outer membrane channel protein PorV [Ohtaekwangia sp.]
MKFRAVLLTALVAGTVGQVSAQTVITDPDDLLGKDNAITTAVPFLAITPDARSAAMGDAGVATAPDANSAYWNAAKLVFIDKSRGGSVSYTPWLGKIVNDMWVGYLSGFMKLSQEQAIGMSLKYFDLGDISFRDVNNVSLGDFNPREFAIDATYSRMLSESLSLGGSLRYIHSNLTGAFAGIDAKPGNSVAVDFGIYYTKPIESSAKGSTISFGGSISNIGAKLSYTDGENRDFIPTTLRFGSAFTTNLDPYNTITFTLDFSKLMVPTPPIRDTNGDIIAGKDDDRPLLSGMFGSFSDAPNGFEEEIDEVMTSIGIEYWYNKVFAGRLGYFNEAATKGNRKYLTVGVGFRKDRFGFDVAYIVPTNKREHPLAETLRFTLLFQIDQTTLEREESVTD